MSNVRGGSHAVPSEGSTSKMGKPPRKTFAVWDLGGIVYQRHLSHL